MNKPEYILCAAIWVNDNQIHEQQPENINIGFVICGRRHHNCYQTITDLKGDVNTYFKSLNISEDDYRQHQGFITSFDRYVNRKEGFKIAKEQKQFCHNLHDDEADNILCSEDLYFP